MTKYTVSFVQRREGYLTNLHELPGQESGNEQRNDVHN